MIRFVAILLIWTVVVAEAFASPGYWQRDIGNYEGGMFDASLSKQIIVRLKKCQKNFEKNFQKNCQKIVKKNCQKSKILLEIEILSKNLKAFF